VHDALTKFRETLERVIGAVIGALDRPEALIVGTITDTGDLNVLGRTTAFSPAQAAAVGGHLRPPNDPHPWPTVMGAGHFGGDPVTIAHVKPQVVAESKSSSKSRRPRPPSRPPPPAALLPSPRLFENCQLG